jgi:hypothetical protein
MAMVLIIFGISFLQINSSNGNKTDTWILDEVTLSLSLVGIGLFAFIFLWFSIKCPVCHKNVGKHILKTSNASKWFTNLISLKNCPHCMDQGLPR